MKICSSCKETKKYSDFNKKRSSKDKLQPNCRACDNARLREHYRNNPEYYRKKKNRLRNGYRDSHKELKESIACADCHVFYPYYVMDWDHRPGEQKTSIVSKLIGKGSITKTKLEIQKCDLVCANCHRIRTFARLELLGERSSKG